MYHILYSAQDKIPEHAYLASPYFNACTKCPRGNTLFSCFMQSVIAREQTRNFRNCQWDPWPPDESISLSWFAAKHAYFIQMLEQMGLPGADHQLQLSWAWYRAQRDGQRNKAHLTERTQTAPSELQPRGNKAQAWSYSIFQEAA